MRVYYADHAEVPMPEGHRFPMHKYRMVREALQEHTLLAASSLHPGSEVSREDLVRTHDSAYVDAVLSGTLDRKQVRRIGLPWTEALVRRVRAAVGGTVQATFDALTDGVAGNLAGGTHHASREVGEGFCVFNDIVVAYHAARARGLVRTATVLDLDVHQGNGTASLLCDDPHVYTLSVHCEQNYPFRKVSGTRDVGLPAGTGDEAFLRAVAAELDAALNHLPDVVFYQAGVDPLREDALGKLELTHEGLLERDRLVLGACERRGLPVVLTLGGGYARPIGPSVEAYVNTYRAAREVFG